jgi:hypothetical protein
MGLNKAERTGYGTTIMPDIPASPRRPPRVCATCGSDRAHYGFGPPHMLDVPWETYAAAIVWVCRTCRLPLDGRNKISSHDSVAG